MAQRLGKRSPIIESAIDRDAFDIDGFDAWLSTKGLAWQPLARGEYDITLEEAQLAYISEDPVLWCRAFLTEPDPHPALMQRYGYAEGEPMPYTFFDYQEESVRAWDQDVIHQDGAEVGKTREITALILWGMCTAFGGTINRPYVLVAAPQTTHLDEIILDIEEHVGVSEDATGPKPYIGHFWLKPKRTPHTMFRFLTPNLYNPGKPAIGRVYFRPAGHDGEAFRGVHVNALGLFDEAAKVKNAVVWSEFHRALKPGCHRRIYSVPDGDNSTEYYRMSQQAVPDLPRGQQGLRLFRWSKALMPPPFWTEERRQHFIAMYGGEDSPGYQRNVLGLHGQQENPVWPWDVLDPNFRESPEYVAIKLLADAGQDSLHVIAYGCDLNRESGKKVARTRAIADRYETLAPYRAKNREAVRTAIRELLREFIQPADKGVYWFGADLGFSKDPTEIFVFREIGHELQLQVRIQAKGVGYDTQAELIYCLDELHGYQGSWGVDFGNAGTAVVQILQGGEDYAEGDYDNRMTGIVFSQAVDAVNEAGDVLEEPDRRTGEAKAVRLPAKELATNLLTARFQRRGFALPMDPDIVQHFSNHTAKQGARHRIFAKENDHTIDAARCAILRKVFNEDVYPDVFASGVHERSAA